jgi:hypothetical protein
VEDLVFDFILLGGHPVLVVLGGNVVVGSVLFQIYNPNKQQT